MAYVQRHMEGLIQTLSKTFSAILVTGPRQAGKTTMLQALIEKESAGRSYVSLDDTKSRILAKEDPGFFLKLHHPPVLIDEIQYAPELFSYIKIHIDQHHNPGDFWMTGSQIYRAIDGLQESLAGRVAILHLPPLSQREIIGAPCAPFNTDIDRLLAERDRIAPVSPTAMFARICHGSMPEALNFSPVALDTYYSSYLTSYLDRDVRQFYGNIDWLKFYRFVVAAAARCAQLLNYKSLADDAELDVATVKNWLNILEALGILFYLHPYSNNVLKRSIHTPKLYFYDTGLVCYLLNMSSPALATTGGMASALVENFAVSEIVKGYQNAGLRPSLYFYRDRDGKEIDVVLESDGKLCPLEIKKTTSPDKRLTNVFPVLDRSPLPRGTSAVLCMADGLSAFDRDNLIVPLWML